MALSGALPTLDACSGASLTPMQGQGESEGGMEDGAAQTHGGAPSGEGSCGQDERPPTHTILKLYQDKMQQDRRGGLMGLIFKKSKGRASMRHSAAEDRVNLSECSDEVEGVKRINMLTLARRARLPLGALVMSLAENGDRREVRLRDDDDHPPDNERQALLSTRTAPMKYVDVSFDETDEIKRQKDSLAVPGSHPKQGGFGLLLSPSTTSAERIAAGSSTAGGAAGGSAGGAPAAAPKDAFREWLSDNQGAPQLHKSSVALELPHRGHSDNEAYLVLDPASVKEGTPQWVFAVPGSMPGEVADPESCEGKLFDNVPSEVGCVTLYCEQGDDSTSLANVIISVELSRPLWAWIVLGAGVACAALSIPILTELHRATSSSSCVAVWWSTGALLFYLAGTLATLLFHRFRPSELSMLRSRGGIIRLALMGICWAAYLLLWSASVRSLDKEEPYHTGPTALAMALGSLSPVGIVLYRALRRQSIFIGEAVGLLFLIVGMLVLAWPQDGWTPHWETDFYSAGSALAMAGFLIAAKTVTSQLPVAPAMLAVSAASFFPLLIVAAAAGPSDTISTSECLGSAWHNDGFHARNFVALLFVSGIQWGAVVHALRYHHPLAVSVSLSIAAIISMFFTSYVFHDIDIIGDFGGKGTVPGGLLATVGCLIAIYSAVVKRQHVEVEITSAHIQKRQRPNFKLTFSTLQKSQAAYDSSLYASAHARQEDA